MKGISVVLILAICVGNIFSYMPVLAAETNRMTMTSLFNDGEWLRLEEGDTVTIESLEEWEMFAKYTAKGYDMQGVTVELLDDIQVSNYTFFYDEHTMRIGINWHGELKAAYDVKKKKYYEDFLSARRIGYPWESEEVPCIQYFNGTFDGKGHCITGAWRDENREAQGVLFSEIENGQVRNLKLSNFFSTDTTGGALCGTFSGEIENCHGSDLFLFGTGGLIGTIPNECEVSVVDCSVNVYMFPGFSCGGIIGNVGKNSEVMLERNHTSGLIYGVEHEKKGVGGMVGSSASYVSDVSNVEIRNCVSEVNIAGEVSVAGGIAGDNVTCLYNCENRGDISLSGRGVAGGLLGSGNFIMHERATVIDKCRNTGKISSSYIAGGIIGNAPEIEIRNTENVGDVCFMGESNVSEESGIGGLVGGIDSVGGPRVTPAPICGVVIKNSFCSGDVMGGEVHTGGIIGTIGAENTSLAIDNVCVYGEVEAEVEKEAGIILGRANTTSVKSLSVEEVKNVYYHEQKTSSVSGDRTKIPACMYPVSEAQMSGGEEDYNIGQGDFAQTSSLCDALNNWCRAQDESEGMIGWKQGEMFPVLEIDDAAKPEKTKPTLKPTPTPTEKPTLTPTIEPTQTPTEKPTPKPTIEPTQTPTEKPTPKPTSTVDPAQSVGPTITPEESPVITPTVTPTIIPTPKPTEKPAIESTVEPTESPLQTEPSSTPPTGVFIPPGTEMPTPLPNQGITPTPAPIMASTPPPTAGTNVKAKKLKAPTFSVKKKQTASGKQYVSIRLKKYKGTHAEIWVGKRNKRKKFVYYKLKLKQNNIRKMKGIFNFQYAKQKGTLAFKIRTYAKQGKKRVYSHKSKAKRIRLS